MDWEFLVGVAASVVSPGLFAFWRGEYLQAPPVIALSHPVPASAAEEFSFQHLEGPIRLTGAKDTQPDRSSDQIGELQSHGVHLLIRKDDVERQGAAEPISAITEASEFQFELVVFFLASAFHNDMGQPVLLPFLLHKLKKCLQAEAERQVIRIGVQAAVLDPQLLLVHYRADEDEVALFNQAVQLFDELPFRSAMGELEIPLLLTDLMLVQHC